MLLYGSFIIHKLIMYYIREQFQPVKREYNRWLNGEYLSGLLQFKGQKGAGNEYVSKVFRAGRQEINSKYYHALNSVQHPSYTGFLQDNWARLILLNAVERLVAAYQAAPGLNRLGRPSSMSFLFTEIMNDGAFRGSLRGLSMSFLQASLVLWPSIALNSNKPDVSVTDFLKTYLFFDFLLYPLDNIKNRMYAETANPQSLGSVLSKVSLTTLYRGLVPRMAFNIPFGAALFETARNQEDAWKYWLATAIAYPLNTFKVRSQTATNNTSIALFRGFVPFMIMNVFFAWKMIPLYTHEKLEEIREECSHEIAQYMGIS